MSKQQKVKQVASLAGNGRPETVADLASGKYYHGGQKISEAEFKRLQNKNVLINLGAGVKPE